MSVSFMITVSFANGHLPSNDNVSLLILGMSMSSGSRRYSSSIILHLDYRDCTLPPPCLIMSQNSHCVHKIKHTTNEYIT